MSRGLVSPCRKLNLVSWLVDGRRRDKPRTRLVRIIGSLILVLVSSVVSAHPSVVGARVAASGRIASYLSLLLGSLRSIVPGIYVNAWQFLRVDHLRNSDATSINLRVSSGLALWRQRLLLILLIFPLEIECRLSSVAVSVDRRVVDACSVHLSSVVFFASGLDY